MYTRKIYIVIYDTVRIRHIARFIEKICTNVGILASGLQVPTWVSRRATICTLVKKAS